MRARGLQLVTAMQLLDSVSVRAVAALGLGALVFIGSRGTEKPVEAPQVEPPLDVAPLASSQVQYTEPPPPPATSLGFTFTADRTTWLAIGDVSADALKALGPSTASAMRVVEDDYVYAAVGPIFNASEFTGAWHEVVFEDGCRETLHDFAMIGRTSGSPLFESNEDHWTASSILAHGEVVMAAKLTHCKGAFATTAPVTRLEPVTDAALASRARSVLVHSEFARKAVAEWKEMRGNHAWTADAKIDTIIVRDRGVTWISAHAHTDGVGCGSPSTNFWGLFRVAADGSLERIALREVDVASIDALIDIDGTPALLAQGLLPSGPTLLDTSGDARTSVLAPYFGCPC
jgi:hypothetical protein